MYQPSPTLWRLKSMSFDDVAGWLDLATAAVSRARYEQHLARVYGFEGAFEAALAYAPRSASVSDLRPRAGYLVEDLIALGVRPAQIAQLPQCPIALFSTAEEALGWLYVVERGARVHAAARLHLASCGLGDACAYLRATSEARASRWTALASALASYDTEHDGQQRIVDAAFVALHWAVAWYRAGTARAA